jgi:hypothetical protein
MSPQNAELWSNLPLLRGNLVERGRLKGKRRRPSYPPAPAFWRSRNGCAVSR